MSNATLEINGDVLSVKWTGSVWEAPCNGTQHGRARDAMRQELVRYLSDCGESVGVEEREAMLDGIIWTARK